jgi:hypothetical protein
LTLILYPTASGHTTSKAVSGVGIFSIFLFGWILSFVYTLNQSLYCTELPNSRNLGKRNLSSCIREYLATILFTCTTGITLGDISWKYYFVWISVDFIAGFLLFFFGVETIGRAFED